ncbi:four-carbon acid sugar kinase family protein [Corynebacterium glaucum]|mgnify:CR=1 FL=1|uniref:four-carbon acid sugar kinase family protein n=1 Tax=Corynebacterium glaucum TaxID=187491 RepID=UPI00265819AA|nr:four-carbon acid sugar kinase family protein [Corynebacterium glaucum]
MVSLQTLVVDYPDPVRVPASSIPTTEVTLIVLDDDPTGTQSVSNLPVLTRWEEDDLEWAFGQEAPAVYVMTNSRSLAPEDARAINLDVARAALTVASKQGKEIAFVSRSDSTLRGHYPLEPDTLALVSDENGRQIDGYVIVPAFGDAGRITVGGVHYAGSKEEGFQKVEDTEFAQDATFGYNHSRIADWVEEKTGGAVSAEQVIEITLDVLRQGKDAVAAKLLEAENRTPIAVDIVTEDDLRLLSLGLIEAENSGKRFIYRVGPPFVRARIGQEVAEPVTSEQVDALRVKAENVVGGLIVIGSHVPTTTRQLTHLKQVNDAPVIEMDVREVIGERREEYIAELAEAIELELVDGNVIFHTSRELVRTDNPDESLAIARSVSDALVAVVNRVVHRVTPAFVLAKGGITSSDVASKGLEMTRATVIGPMQPGIISMWQLIDGPAAGVPYIVFAGNVGTDRSLAEVVEALSTEQAK